MLRSQWESIGNSQHGWKRERVDANGPGQPQMAGWREAGVPPLRQQLLLRPSVGWRKHRAGIADDAGRTQLRRRVGGAQGEEGNDHTYRSPVGTDETAPSSKQSTQQNHKNSHHSATRATTRSYRATVVAFASPAYR